MTIFVGIFSSEAVHFSKPFSVQIAEQYRDEPIQRVTMLVGITLLISLLSAENYWALKKRVMTIDQQPPINCFAWVSMTGACSFRSVPEVLT